MHATWEDSRTTDEEDLRAKDEDGKDDRTTIKSKGRKKKAKNKSVRRINQVHN